MANEQENQLFLSNTTDLGAMTHAVTYAVDLKTLKTRYGNNFNTLIIVNKSAVEIKVTLNGVAIGYVAAGDSFALDWRDGIQFDDIAILNNDAAVDTSANQVRISVGRTGNAAAIIGAFA